MHLTGTRARLVRVAVSWLAVVGIVLVGAVPAVAVDIPPGCSLITQEADGGSNYTLHCPGQSGSPDDGAGGAQEPTCALKSGQEYCVGASACWANIPSALPPERWPEETRPSPEAIYTYQSCMPDPTGTLSGWSWYDPPGPSLAELAQQAYGELATPAFTVGFNPPGRAVVGVPTWFWAQTAQGGQITGSSALGVVAIATPGHLEVDPGDGSPLRRCTWSTTASDTCSHEYARSSAREPVGPDGQRAYVARIRMVYDVRFENYGTPLTLAGLPETLPSVWVEGHVPVAEVQTLTTTRP